MRKIKQSHKHILKTVNMFKPLWIHFQPFGILSYIQQYKNVVENCVQARAELGQAQLKLRLGFPPTNLHQINEQETL